MSDYRIEAATKEEWVNRALNAEAKLIKAMNVLCYMVHPKLDKDLLVWMNEKEMRRAAKTVLTELEGK